MQAARVPAACILAVVSLTAALVASPVAAGAADRPTAHDAAAKKKKAKKRPNTRPQRTRKAGPGGRCPKGWKTEQDRCLAPCPKGYSAFEPQEDTYRCGLRQRTQLWYRAEAKRTSDFRQPGHDAKTSSTWKGSVAFLLYRRCTFQDSDLGAKELELVLTLTPRVPCRWQKRFGNRGHDDFNFKVNGTVGDIASSASDTISRTYPSARTDPVTFVQQRAQATCVTQRALSWSGGTFDTTLSVNGAQAGILTFRYLNFAIGGTQVGQETVTCSPVLPAADGWSPPAENSSRSFSSPGASAVWSTGATPILVTGTSVSGDFGDQEITMKIEREAGPGVGHESAETIEIALKRCPGGGRKAKGC